MTVFLHTTLCLQHTKLLGLTNYYTSSHAKNIHEFKTTCITSTITNIYNINADARARTHAQTIRLFFRHTTSVLINNVIQIATVVRHTCHPPSFESSTFHHAPPKNIYCSRHIYLFNTTTIYPFSSFHLFYFI
jgi:hypothetical protein